MPSLEHHPTGVGNELIEQSMSAVTASVDVFVPYDLRRSIATGARSILGKEAAKVLLGHTRTDTTDIYLLEEVQETMKVATLLDSSM